jgi:hypothetical protein
VNWLLMWNAFCLLCVLIYIHEPKQKSPQKKRNARDPWIASMVAHAQGLNGFSDPLYNTDESAPMELHR